MPQEPSFGPFWSESAGEAGPVSNFCEYARLGLAVWRAKPAVHHQFDDWLFAAMKPPSLNEAEDYTAQLVGAQQILTDCQIHRANWLAVDSSAMPQIIMGDAVSSGPINSVERLSILLN